MTNTYHATPYDISAAGFYFSTYEDYLAKAATHCNDYGDPVEEYEIQYIDGENSAIFEALGVNQANLKRRFDDFEDLDGDEIIKVIYMADHLDERIEDIIAKLDDVILFEGRALEYAQQYIEETGLLDQIPKNLRFYFDIEAFARDMVLGGDITEVEIDGKTYVFQYH